MEFCPICFEDKELKETKCKHKFCNECIDTWLLMKNSCPLCRKELITRPPVAHVERPLEVITIMRMRPQSIPRKGKLITLLQFAATMMITAFWLLMGVEWYSIRCKDVFVPTLRITVAFELLMASFWTLKRIKKCSNDRFS